MLRHCALPCAFTQLVAAKDLAERTVEPSFVCIHVQLGHGDVPALSQDTGVDTVLRMISHLAAPV